MNIQIGDRFPEATLFESTELGEHCPVSPGKMSIKDAAKGKRVVVFGLPGAYTTTCSGKHVPGYLRHLDALKAKGVDEVWCVSVNDGYVMAAWAVQQGAFGKIRFLGDGNGELTQKLGIANDSSAWGMGLRMRRCSFLLEDGVVKQANVEAPGKFEVSDADTMLRQLGG